LISTGHSSATLSCNAVNISSSKFFSASYCIIPIQSYNKFGVKMYCTIPQLCPENVGSSQNSHNNKQVSRFRVILLAVLLVILNFCYPLRPLTSPANILLFVAVFRIWNCRNLPSISIQIQICNQNLYPDSGILQPKDKICYN
jgi:hypothetical protein